MGRTANLVVIFERFNISLDQTNSEEIGSRPLVRNETTNFDGKTFVFNKLT